LRSEAEKKKQENRGTDRVHKCRSEAEKKRDREDETNSRTSCAATMWSFILV
jgi:hypothetical protein